MIVYLAGKYSGDTKKNIALAKKYALKLWEKGYVVICPHLNTQNFDKISDVSYDKFLNGYLEIIKRCDVLVLLPNWRESKGAKIEKQFAEENGIPVYPISLILEEKSYPQVGT